MSKIYFKSSRKALNELKEKINLLNEVDRLREKQDEQPTFDRLLRILALEEKCFQ